MFAPWKLVVILQNEPRPLKMPRSGLTIQKYSKVLFKVILKCTETLTAKPYKYFVHIFNLEKIRLLDVCGQSWKNRLNCPMQVSLRSYMYVILLD